MVFTDQVQITPADSIICDPIKKWALCFVFIFVKVCTGVMVSVKKIHTKQE